MSSRAFLVLLSQGLSSLSNFALVLFVAKYGTLDELASLAIALLVFGLGTNLLRGGLFRRPIVEQSTQLAADAAWASQLLGVALVALLGAIAAVSEAPVPMAIVAASLPALYAHDAGRQRLLVAERYARLVLMDAVWLATFVFIVLTFWVASAGALVACWAIGCVAGLIAGGRWAWPLEASWSSAMSLVRNAWAELLEIFVLRATPFLAVLLVARIADYGEFGAWSSLRSFFGPLTVLYGSLSSGGLLLIGALGREHPQRLASVAVVLSATMPLLAGATGAAISEVFLPSGFGPAPAVADGFRQFVVPVAVFVGFAGLIQVARAFAHALGINPEHSLRVQSQASVVGALGLVGGLPWGMSGAAWGAVAGSLLGSVIWLRTSAPMVRNRSRQR